jgi:uncharacterized protein YqgC (DUF456 family)
MPLHDVVWSLLLLAVNALGVLLVAMSLPGTWLIAAATALFAWLHGYPRLLGIAPLVVLLGIALAAEVVEFVAGAAGVRSAGGSARAAAGAVAGGLIGGIAGTFVIPIPILGSVLGAALGSFAGAFLAERPGERGLDARVDSGKAAFRGRLIGTLLKLAAAVLMWIVVALALVL